MLGLLANCFHQLLRVELDGAYTSLLQRSGDTSDGRLVTRLVAGTTVWRRQLDAVLDSLHPSGALDATVRNILRVALLELLHLGTPPHAAVDEAVTATRALGKASAAGLVNALLRKATRQRDAGQLHVPVAAPSDGASQLSLAYSMPEWLVERWVATFGRGGAEELLAASNRDSPAYGVRCVQPQASSTMVEDLQRMGLDARPSELLPSHVVRVEGTLAPLLPHLRSGTYAIQDEAAALVVMLFAHDILARRQGASSHRPKVADVCAAPGGKCLFAAWLGAHVTAVDVNPGRARLLREAAEAQHVADRVDVHVADAREWATSRSGDASATFDVVLVDAPCTGTGVMAKRADLRWRRTPGDVAAAAALQLQLLTSCSALVSPGGCLVYSTCSLEPEENEGVVDAFLASHAGAAFEVQPCAQIGAIPKHAVSPDGRFLAPLPHVCGTDGAFGARLTRRASSKL